MDENGSFLFSFSSHFFYFKRDLSLTNVFFIKLSLNFNFSSVLHAPLDQSNNLHHQRHHQQLQDNEEFNASNFDIVLDNIQLEEFRQQVDVPGPPAENVTRTILNGEQSNTSLENRASGNEKPFRSLVPFCVVYGIGSMVSQSVGVYLSSQVTVLERAFGLSSTRSGILLSANDVGFVLSVLLASHFLKK